MNDESFKTISIFLFTNNKKCHLLSFSIVWLPRLKKEMMKPALIDIMDDRNNYKEAIIAQKKLLTLQNVFSCFNSSK